MQTFLPISILLFNITHGSSVMNPIYQSGTITYMQIKDLWKEHVAGCADQQDILRKRFSDPNNCSKFEKYMKHQVIGLASDTQSDHVAGCADQQDILRQRFSDPNNGSKFEKYMKHQVIGSTTDTQSEHVAGCADQQHILRKRFSDSNNCTKSKKYMKPQVIDLTSDTQSEMSENEMPDQQTEPTNLKCQSEVYTFAKVDQPKNIIPITEESAIKRKIENRSIAARTNVNPSHKKKDVLRTNENTNTVTDETVIPNKTTKKKTSSMYTVSTAKKLYNHIHSVQSKYDIQKYFNKMINDMMKGNKKYILKFIYKSLLETFEFQASVEEILAHLVILQKKYKFNVVTTFQCSKSSDECFGTSDVIEKMDTSMQLADSGSNNIYQIYEKVENKEEKKLYIEAKERQTSIIDLSKHKQDISKDNEQVEQKKKALLTYQSNNKEQTNPVIKTTEALFIDCTNFKELYKFYRQEINKIMSFKHSNITHIHIRKLIYNMPELLYYFAWNLNRIKQLKNIFAFEENKRRLCKEILPLKVVIENLKLTAAYPCDSSILHAYRDSIANFRNLIMDNLNTYVYQSTKYSFYKLAIYYHDNINHLNDPCDTLSYILFTMTFTLESELYIILLNKFLQRLNINGFGRTEANKPDPRDFFTFIFESKQASSHIFYTLYLMIEFMESKKGIMPGENIKDNILFFIKKICILIYKNPETQSIDIKMLSFDELFTFLCNRLRSMSLRS